MQRVTVVVVLTLIADAHAALDSMKASLSGQHLNQIPMNVLRNAREYGDFRGIAAQAGGQGKPFDMPSLPKSPTAKKGARSDTPFAHPIAALAKHVFSAAALANPLSEQHSDSVEMTNLYGSPIKSCRPGSEYYCTNNGESPAICIGVLPDDVEPNFEVPVNLFDNSQCLSIWDNHFDDLSTGMASGKVVLKCDALPASVLKSHFSMKKWHECDIELQETFTNDPDARSLSCERLHNAVLDICSTCMEQATSATGMQTLADECSALVQPGTLSAQSSSNVIGLAAVVLMGLLASSGVYFMFRIRSGALTAAEERLL